MRFYGAEYNNIYNNIELGFASFNIVVLGSIKPHIDLVQVHYLYIIIHIIKNPFYWLKDNHMTKNNLDIFALIAANGE